MRTDYNFDSVPMGTNTTDVQHKKTAMGANFTTDTAQD